VSVVAGGKGRWAAIWALSGVSGLFLMAVLRLGRRGLHTIEAGLAPSEWTALLLLTAVFVYGEGVRALQRRWVPRLVRRARSLREESAWLKALGPLYGLSLVGAPPARLLRSWGGTLAIVLAVLLVRTFPEPWRGIVDFAVAAALSWGLVSIGRGAGEALRG